MNVGINLSLTRRRTLLPSSLLTGLSAYWKLDNVNDSHGVNHLTNGGASFVAGKVGNAASLTFGQLNLASNAALQLGDIDVYFSGWAYLNSGSNGGVMLSKFGSTNANRQFLLTVSTGDLVFQWNRNATGSFSTVEILPNPIAPEQWFFIEAYHNTANGTIGLAYNGGDFTTVSAVGGNASGTTDVIIGSFASALGEFNGLIDEVMYRKQLPTPAERAELYNSGNGTTYPFTGAWA